MIIGCGEVILELSNFIDHEVGSELRQRIAQHLENCQNCTAIHDGMRNVILLICDDKVLELPSGFSHRLYARLVKESQRS